MYGGMRSGMHQPYRPGGGGHYRPGGYSGGGYSSYGGGFGGGFGGSYGESRNYARSMMSRFSSTFDRRRKDMYDTGRHTPSRPSTPTQRQGNNPKSLH